MPGGARPRSSLDHPQDQTGPIRMFRIYGDMNREMQDLIGVEWLGLNPLLGCRAIQQQSAHRNSRRDLRQFPS